MIHADTTGLATSVHFYSMSAQMKVFIDRSFARFQEMKEKFFYFIVTAAAPQHEAAEETIAGLRGYLRCLLDAQEMGIIYGTGAWDKGDILRHPAYEKAFELGKALPIQHYEGSICNGKDPKKLRIWLHASAYEWRRGGH